MTRKAGRILLAALAVVAVISLVGCQAAGPQGGAVTKAPEAATKAPEAAATKAPEAAPTKAQSGEAFPTRPIELQTCFGPGGGADQMARILGPELEKVLGQPIQISNVSGASGDTGMAQALANKADGYTVIFQNSNSVMRIALGTSPFKREQIEYLCRAHMSDFWLFVHSDDERFKTWDEVVSYAKANPGKLTVAAEGLGGEDELFIRFLAENGIELKIVPYSAPGERYTALVGRHEAMLIEQVGDVIQYINSKQIRPVLVFAKERMKDFPDVPCSYEKGLKLDVKQFRGFLVKAGTPKDRVEKLASAFEKAYWSDEYQKALKRWVVDPKATWLGPAEYSKFIDEDMKVLAELGKKYGFGKKQ